MHTPPATVPTNIGERSFFVSFSERIAALHRQHSATQVQLAEAFVSQQTMPSYEVGRRRIPVSALPAVAQTLSVSLDELFGEAPKPARGRRGPVPQWQEQMEAIAKLPRARQRFVTQMLQTVLAQSSH
jgi:DNA-binding XRE family transcriptional regulator